MYAASRGDEKANLIPAHGIPGKLSFREKRCRPQVSTAPSRLFLLRWEQVEASAIRRNPVSATYIGTDHKRNVLTARGRTKAVPLLKPTREEHVRDVSIGILVCFNAVCCVGVNRPSKATVVNFQIAFPHLICLLRSFARSHTPRNTLSHASNLLGLPCCGR